MPKRCKTRHFLTIPARCFRPPNCAVLLLLLVLTCLHSRMQAQTLLRGTVTDKATQEPLPYVSISIQNSSSGTYTDENGAFEVATTLVEGKLVISMLGYKTQTLKFSGHEAFSIILKSDRKQLEEITVQAGKRKYRNKDNPAVALIREAIRHRPLNQIKRFSSLNYQAYEKFKLSLRNPGPEILNNPLLRPYRFLLDNIDTVSRPGAALLPVYIEEQISHRFAQQNPDRKKTFVRARQKIEFDKRYVNNESLTTLLRYLNQEIDIYDNSIYLLTNSFLSPIADMAPTFYKYYIVDTLEVGGTKLVQLAFEPRNLEDLLFYGQLSIALDGTFAVGQAELKLSKYANLNWITGLQVDIAYQKSAAGTWYPDKTLLEIDYGVQAAKQGLIGSHLIHYQDFDTLSRKPAAFFEGPEVEYAKSIDSPTSDFVSAQRPVRLEATESALYRDMDSLNSMPSFKRKLQWFSFLLAGYLHLGKFEIGHYGTFFTSNPVEGVKLRIAGRTTEAFSRRIYLQGNLGYGFKDQRWKHYGSVAYAFNRSSIFDYPQHYLQLSHTYDTRIPGLDLQFKEEESPLLSFKRGVNDKYLYNDIWALNYVAEFPSRIRLEAGIERWNQEAAGSLEFILSDQPTPRPVRDITTTELKLLLRWAPHERLFDKKEGRRVIPSVYPVLTARFTQGLNGFLDGGYDYRKYQLKVEKRFLLSQLGHADVELAGGYLEGSVPYPLLFIPRANQTYGFYFTSFNLMNFMEFVSSRYIELYLDYHMHGFILNKIPLIKKLGLREVFTLKGIYGGLDAKNRPPGEQLMALPVNAEGRPLAYTFGAEPYLECSVGVENIFRIFRVDFVKRLNYLHHPDVPGWGIRVRTHVAF